MGLVDWLNHISWRELLTGFVTFLAVITIVTVLTSLFFEIKLVLSITIPAFILGSLVMMIQKLRSESDRES
ncbi:Uncharacterised protein [Arcanobacterium haemolyticum]|nr:Uncharacterised protein [Arcanobacterium haemolyticum]